MPLHEFSKTHVDADCSAIGGEHENELFYNCRFDRLEGLTLKDCELNQSEFITDSVAHAMGLTLTLGCKSFRGVTLSSLLFDLVLMLLCMTKGNTPKREKLLDVVGRPRAAALMRLLGATE